MSDDHDDDLPADDAPEGRGGSRNPPEEYRWKPGQSGNRGGRPIGAKNRPKESPHEDYRKMILEEGRRQMIVTDASAPLTLTTAQAIRRMQGIVALKGSVRAMRHYLESFDRAEKEEQREREALIQQIGDLKVDWYLTVESYRTRGRKPPKPLVDPDDMILDPATGDLRMRAPATAEEAARWARYRDACEGWLQQVDAQLEGASRRRRKRLQEDLKLVEASLNALRAALSGSREAMLIVEHLEPHFALMFPEED